MTHEDKQLFVRAQIDERALTVAGMQAENYQRLHTGQAMAYTEGDFVKVLNSYNWLLSHNGIIEYLRD